MAAQEDREADIAVGTTDEVLRISPAHEAKAAQGVDVELRRAKSTTTTNARWPRGLAMSHAGVAKACPLTRQRKNPPAGSFDHPATACRRRSTDIPPMSLLWRLVILVAANLATIGAMLLARRRAPRGNYFGDGDRASGVFGVLAGGFAILAGFIIFLAFTSYDQSRSGGEAAALTVIQQFETAQFLPAATHDRLTGELVCTDARSYPRSGRRWRTERAATRSTPGRSRSFGA
jgi:hypothetical protein